MGGRFCNQCGAKLGPGAKFCNQCGASSAGAGSGGGSGPLVGHRAAAAATLGGNNLPWWIAGATMIGLILMVAWSVIHSQNPAAPAAGGAPPGMGGNAAMGASAIDLSKMSPREAADRLFDHVMRSLSAGDTADAMNFQPMAVEAYQVAEPLDLDGLFHQALLEDLADPAAALATAKRILAADPDHILGLGAAAEAAISTGDTTAALGYYKHLLEVYDAQVAKKLPEYEAHAGLLPEMKSEAEAFVVQH